MEIEGYLKGLYVYNLGGFKMTNNKTAGKTATKHYGFMERGTDEPDESNWTEDPETEFECNNCGTTWKLKDSVACPNCDPDDSIGPEAQGRSDKAHNYLKNFCEDHTKDREERTEFFSALTEYVDAEIELEKEVGR